MKKVLVTLTALAGAAAASPTLAQTAGDQWTGFYAGGSVGYAFQGGDNGSSILFDNDLDGSFGDTVRTGMGADAFSPGFCGGAATGPTPASGCDSDGDGIEYYGHIGFDQQINDNWVIGVIAEFGRAEIDDSVSGFSTTPAFYTMTRKLKHNAGLRARIGYTPNGTTLIYATGGGAYGKVKNSFTTSNGANSFTGNGNSDAWGLSVGGGVEQKLSRNLSVGIQYLYTDLKDNDYRVAVGPGTAPSTNPFLLVNPAGTDFRRSDTSLSYHSVRLTASYRF
ncbi:outer membrane beta-barrel protein [Iodidimonas sp. SYSU 1G8]|uniref:outer membrane protein n=1 Tax=Iodidimonas sp. SYSU 1G8 TaxID=3133967 RepID=UPI0031FEE7FB